MGSDHFILSYRSSIRFQLNGCLGGVRTFFKFPSLKIFFSTP